MNPDWGEVAALAQVIAGFAIVTSLLLVSLQLRKQGEDQFVSATSDSFRVWVSDEFQRSHQWVLYDLTENTWRSFASAHRGKYGERAFYRVGAFYNRVGYLVTRNMLGGHDQILLDTLAGAAIAVWHKIEPLVLEARLIENSTLFQDFERMLPECYLCYVPGQPVPPAILAGAAQAATMSREE